MLSLVSFILIILDYRVWRIERNITRHYSMDGPTEDPFLEIAYFQKHGLQHVVLLARQDKRGDCLPMIIDHRSCFGYLKSAFKLV